MEKKGFTIFQKMFMSILLVLSLFVISDISLNTFQPNSHTAHAAPGEGYTGTADSDKEAKKEKDKEENKDKEKDKKTEKDNKDDKKDDGDKKESSDGDSEGKKKKSSDGEEEKNDEDMSRSYASFIFDSTDKNQAIFYFASDAPNGSPSVETVVNYAAHHEKLNKLQKGTSMIKEFAGAEDKDKFTRRGGEGVKYATFLKTLHDWNLYHTYTNQIEVGAGVLGKLFVAAYGGFLLGLVWLAKMLDQLLILFAHLVQRLNIFTYLAPNGKLPDDSMIKGLQPLLDLFHGASQIAMIILALGLAFAMLITLMGVGKASQSKGKYFLSSFTKKMIQAFAIIGLPFMMAGFFAAFADAILQGENPDKEGTTYIKSSIKDIPKNYIVDTEGWVNHSIKTAADPDNVNKPQMNDGYVLIRPKGTPESGRQSVLKNYPSPDYVKRINTLGGNKVTGEELLNKWRNADTFTPNDLDSMYQISKKDKKSWFDKDEKRLFQFKLAPESDKVKVFSGKDGVISLDLNEVSIRSASLAGNSAFGVFLNGALMGIQMTCTVYVALALMFSIFAGAYKSIITIATNISLAQLGSMKRLVAVFAAFIMLVVTFFTSILLISLYTSLTAGLTSSITKSVEQALPKDTSGVMQHFISAFISAFIYLFGVTIVFKMRHAIVQGVQEFFTNIMNAIGLDISGKHSGVKHPAARAMEGVADASDDGEGFAKTGVAATSAGVGAMGMSAAKGLTDKDKSASEKAKDAFKAGSNAFASKASGQLASYANDKDNQNLTGRIAGQLSEGIDAMNDKIQNGNEDDVIEAQEKATDDADKKVSDAEAAREKLDELKDKRDEAEANDASQEELEAMDAKIADQQDKVDELEKDEADAIKDMNKTGAAQELANESAEQTDQDRKDAEQALAKAERDLEDLENEREMAEANGATQEELDDMDKEIEQARNRVDDAQEKLDMINNRGDGVIDSNNINDQENDVLANKQNERDKKAALDEAMESGNLSQNEVNEMKDIADSYSTELENQDKELSNDLSNEKEKLAAMNRVGENGQSFTQDDIDAQDKAVEAASQNLSDKENKLQDLKNSNASKDSIKKAEKEVNDAKETLANEQEIQNAMKDASFDNADRSVQESHVNALAKDHKAAQQRAENLKQQKANGGNVSDSEIEAAENEAIALKSQHASAKSMLNNMQASNNGKASAITPKMVNQQKAHVSDLSSQVNVQKQRVADLKQRQANGENISQSTISQAEKGLQAKQARLNTANNLLSTMQSKQQNAGKVTSQAMAASGARVQRIEKAQEQAQQRYNNLVEQQKNGISVSPQKMQQAKADLDTANRSLNTVKSIQNGLTAQRLTGGSVSQDQIKNQTQVVSSKSAALNKVRQARSNMKEVGNANKMSKTMMTNMSQASRIVKQSSAKAVSDANDAVSKQQAILNKVESDYNKPNSRVTTKQLRKEQLKLQNLQNAADQAQAKDKGVTQTSKSINRTGRQMKQNITQASKDYKLAQAKKKRSYSELTRLGRSGGINSSSIKDIQQKLADDRSRYESDSSVNREAYKKHKQNVIKQADIKRHDSSRVRRGRKRTGTSNEYWK